MLFVLQPPAVRILSIDWSRLPAMSMSSFRQMLPRSASASTPMNFLLNWSWTQKGNSLPLKYQITSRQRWDCVWTGSNLVGAVTTHLFLLFFVKCHVICEFLSPVLNHLDSFRILFGYWLIIQIHNSYHALLLSKMYCVFFDHRSPWVIFNQTK